MKTSLPIYSQPEDCLHSFHAEINIDTDDLAAKIETVINELKIINDRDGVICYGLAMQSTINQADTVQEACLIWDYVANVGIPKIVEDEALADAMDEAPEIINLLNNQDAANN